MLYDANGNEVLQLTQMFQLLTIQKLVTLQNWFWGKIEAAGDDTSIQLFLGAKGVYVVEFLSSGTRNRNSIIKYCFRCNIEQSDV